MTFVGSCFIQQ